MSSNDNKLLNHIKNDKEMDIHLPQYENRFSHLYFDYASLQLFFSFYTLYEEVYEDDLFIPEELDTLKKLVGTPLNELTVAQVDEFRKHMLNVMQNITNHTDTLQVFEHLMNRIEYRFKEEETPVDLNLFTTKVNQFLFMDKDAVVTNDKVRTVVSELPVRMTKNRFYDILTSSFTIYNEAGKSAVDGFSYMLRTVGMLTDELEPLPMVGDIREFIDTLKHMDYKTISQEQFVKVRDTLQEYSKQLEQVVTVFMQIQEALNHLYVLVLLQSCLEEKEKTNHRTMEQIYRLSDGFTKDIGVSVLDGCNEYLESIEGVQEDLVEKIMKFEGPLYDVVDDYPDQTLQDLEKCSLLVSSSVFVPLDSVDEEEEVDVAYVNQVRDDLIRDFGALFAAHSREINRSVMAMVIGAVPVFFQNSKEITEYVADALTSCSAKDEVRASIDIIQSLME